MSRAGPAITWACEALNPKPEGRRPKALFPHLGADDGRNFPEVHPTGELHFRHEQRTDSLFIQARLESEGAHALAMDPAQAVSDFGCRASAFGFRISLLGAHGGRSLKHLRPAAFGGGRTR